MSHRINSKYCHLHYVSLLLAVAFAFYQLFIPSIAAASYENYGSTHYPIWSELSYFERSTLDNLNKSRSNDPESLLALYLVASGVRDAEQYNSAAKKVKIFITQTKKLIINNDNQQLMGDIINKQMHQYFFLHHNQDDTPKGYSAEQSRLMGIFENGVFNCVSSSLLYVVLGRYFDLNIEGVLLPSHVFIQLNVKGGENIEIETTSANGFDIEHNENFYAKQNNEWFSSRGLEVATYQDYLNRTLITPTLLGARNMLNQHTGTDKMALIDSGRLAEISAYIDPSNIFANEKRLYFYATQIHEFINNEQWSILLRLFQTTYQRVIIDSRQFSNAENMQSNLQLYLSGAMLAYAKAGEIELTLDAMGELLSHGLKSPKDQVEIDNRVINAVKILLNKLVQQKRYSEGLLALSLIEGHLSNPDVWPEMLSWFYLNWAQQYWEVKDWAEVIEILTEYLDAPNAKQASTNINKALTDAYSNWVTEAIQDKDLGTAEDIIENCNNSLYQTGCSEAQLLLKKAKKNTSFLNWFTSE